jgi:hypothetical protein
MKLTWKTPHAMSNDEQEIRQLVSIWIAASKAGDPLLSVGPVSE